MDTYRIRINYSDRNLCSRDNLLRILSNFNIRVTRVVHNTSHYFVHLFSATDTERVFDNDVGTALRLSSFTALLPGELKANRSVLLINVDREILKQPEANIREELIRCNNWMVIDGSPSLLEVARLGQSSAVKLVFNSSHRAERVLSQGVNMFHLHIPAQNIVKDRFVRIDTCYTCYVPESHTTNNCPQKMQNPAFKLCSNCGQSSHTYTNCSINKSDFHCLNCRGNHSALSMACPLRKKVLKEKRNNLNNKPFSEAVKQGSNVNFDIMSKTTSCIVLSLLKNVENPGTFSDELNALYKMNGLPTLNLTGFIPPSISTLQSCFGSPAFHSAAQNGTTAAPLSSVAAPASTAPSHSYGVAPAGTTPPPLSGVAPASTTPLSRYSVAPVFTTPPPRYGVESADTILSPSVTTPAPLLSGVPACTTPGWAARDTGNDTVCVEHSVAPTAAAVEETDVGGSAGLPVSTIPQVAMETECGTTTAREMKEATVTAASKLPANRADGDTAAVTMTTNNGLCSDADQEGPSTATAAALEVVAGALADVFVRETEATAGSTTGAGLINDKSSSRTIINKTPKEAKQTRSVSKKQVSNQGKPPVWGDFLLYRIWGTKAKINNSTELTNEVDEGNLIIVRRDGTVADYSTVMSLSRIKPVPASTPLKREEFAALKSTPRRFLETHGKR